MTIGIPTLPADPTPTPAPRRSGRGLVVLLLVLLVSTGAAVAWWQSRGEGRAGTTVVAERLSAADTSARAPAGVRVRVRVLNTSGVTGLARRATAHLREYGFDVVDFASGRTDAYASTRITVHTGRTEWGERARKALGVGVVGTDPDSSRHVDLTVYVGRDWRPSTETLRP